MVSTINLAYNDFVKRSPDPEAMEPVLKKADICCT